MKGKTFMRFPFFVLSEKSWQRHGLCPHCRSGSSPEKVLDVQLGSSVADFKVGIVYQCNACEYPFMVVEFPVIDHSHPIELQWRTSF